MNELIPIKNDEIPLSSYESSVAMQSPNAFKHPSQNKFIWYLFPIFFLFLIRHRKNIIGYKNTEGQEFQARPFPATFNLADPATIDKISFLLDGIKKVSAIRELKKNMLDSETKDAKSTLDTLTEMFERAKKISTENSNPETNSISNIISLFDKFKDIKKIMDIQNAVKDGTENKDINTQINNIIEVMRPMLPPDQANNIDNFKKIAQMMKLMNLTDLPKDERDNSTQNIDIEIHQDA